MIQDVTGKLWVLQLHGYFMSDGSYKYLLGGIGPFIQYMRLHIGDTGM